MSRRARGLALAVVAVVLFSLSLPLIKVALRGYDVVTVSLGRSALAAGLAGPALLAARAPRPRGRELGSVALTAAGGIVGFPVLSTIALQRTTSAHAAVVIALLPLATAAWAVARADERPPVAFWSAAALGTALVAGYALGRGGAEDGDLLADALLLAAVVAASFGYAEGAVLARTRPGWQVVSWTLVFSAPVTVAATGVWLGTHPHDTSPATLPTLALAYQAAITAFLAYLLWYAGLAGAGVARGAQVQNLQPLLTVGWSALLLGEAVGAATIGTALGVLGCVVWAQRARTG